MVGAESVIEQYLGSMVDGIPMAEGTVSHG
jgi:hypothetical protein